MGVRIKEGYEGIAVASATFVAATSNTIATKLVFG